MSAKEEKLSEEDMIKSMTRRLGYNPFESADTRNKRDMHTKSKQKRRAKNKAARKARRTK